ncbi:hypothetical protein TBLA_0D02290 [Henningerozyma blattae CBS 6284]|uniref:Uncharacterized protein n=1 Tax=Henningerozyma blattae (strain ATCC 34711 / CBS 6284 / DSM 70876 / NBRC 10599 / NRRL Y-10934 / UCD 77-7) TaxID=1071380 RepID=I2H2Y1_HENB6|nr:hypothetical protein TBLA_0D02290 [Tetrapisispora blattae CBS 6284]CCH60733.1 hypothetical protein TBLA_0D02290 [Tetrapisispora blattae CBS 6284]
MAPEIPGYYFDPAKNRYFKIGSSVDPVSATVPVSSTSKRSGIISRSSGGENENHSSRKKSKLRVQMHPEKYSEDLTPLPDKASFTTNDVFTRLNTLKLSIVLETQDLLQSKNNLHCDGLFDIPQYVIPWDVEEPLSFVHCNAGIFYLINITSNNNSEDEESQDISNNHNVYKLVGPGEERYALWFYHFKDNSRQHVINLPKIGNLPALETLSCFEEGSLIKIQLTKGYLFFYFKTTFQKSSIDLSNSYCCYVDSLNILDSVLVSNNLLLVITNNKLKIYKLITIYSSSNNNSMKTHLIDGMYVDPNYKDFRCPIITFNSKTDLAMSSDLVSITLDQSYVQFQQQFNKSNLQDSTSNSLSSLRVFLGFRNGIIIKIVLELSHLKAEKRNRGLQIIKKSKVPGIKSIISLEQSVRNHDYLLICGIDEYTQEVVYFHHKFSYENSIYDPKDFYKTRYHSLESKYNRKFKNSRYGKLVLIGSINNRNNHSKGFDIFSTTKFNKNLPLMDSKEAINVIKEKYKLDSNRQEALDSSDTISLVSFFILENLSYQSWDTQDVTEEKIVILFQMNSKFYSNDNIIVRKTFHVAIIAIPVLLPSNTNYYLG